MLGRAAKQAMPIGTQPGALVISLDLELHWGVRDHRRADSPYGANLRGARQAVPRMLALFEKHRVAATWAAVGFLFARDRDELEAHYPSLRPSYRNLRLDPYREPLGPNETEDPLHFGASLLKTIAATPRQEIASHTFSHYFCLEEGAGAASFRADLEAAQRIAQSTLGMELKSLVFPRNQFQPGFLPLAAECGFVCYRGNRRGGAYRPVDTRGQSSLRHRALRLADAYLPLPPSTSIAWADAAARPSGLNEVRASRFLFPYRPRIGWAEAPLRLRRIKQEMRQAARLGRIYHLWWHPHNFGAHLDRSLDGLDQLLREFSALRDAAGFRSSTMLEIAQEAGRQAAAL